MCELFAMSSRVPAALTYSLPEFSENGSSLRSNRHGWGIALSRDRDAILIKEPEPATNSRWVRFIAENAIPAKVAIAHVRDATRGAHTMENTHPFRRALGKRTHLFAHNGTLEDIENRYDPRAHHYRPIGETDSELAFCVLLSQLKAAYDEDDLPPLDTRFEIFAAFCADMRQLGPCNFLYFDGDVLFVHAHRRYHELNGQFEGPRPPGLQILRCWTCAAGPEVHTAGLDLAMRDLHTTLVASVPLDDQAWQPLPEGAVLAIRDGEILRSEGAGIESADAGQTAPPASTEQN